MSKNQKQKSEQPTVADELLANGTTTLQAETREALMATFEKLKASLADVTLVAGCVGRSKDDGCFALRIDIV
jgi:hypothetical protein